MSSRILVVDDEQSLLDFLRVLLEDAGYGVTTADSVTAARDRIPDGYDLVLCDLMMPDGSGIDVLRDVKERDDRTSVIMMTAFTSTASAIEAMKLGAYDYISKPFDVEELKLLIAKALEKIELVDENVYLRKELEQRYGFDNIIGRSRAMQEVFELVDRIAKTSSTVLIQGESGTGKELIARAIHYSGPRSSKKFLSVNCGAMPENLLESELFGHERGAFTGAVKQKDGLFHAADAGTLLLDEIGEMTPPMQVKLLRALQEKKVRRVGGNSEDPVDVRIIAATNQDLRELIETNEFREDLFYRIHVIPVELPPLRQRREDVPLLVEHFLKKASDEIGVEPKQITVEAMRLLEEYRWPGNVRELENVVERILALSSDDRITPDDIPSHLLRPASPALTATELPEEGLNLEEHLDAIREDLIRQALSRTGGVQTKAAEHLGMTFRSFRYYAKKLGVTSP